MENIYKRIQFYYIEFTLEVKKKGILEIKKAMMC